MTTGEGGMITTDDEQFYHRCRYLRDHAMSKEKRYWHTEVGYNYRMTNLQAALGCAQLERRQELMNKRQSLFAVYHEELVDMADTISLNRTTSWAQNSYWLICAEFNHFDESKRNLLMRLLREQGIDSRPYFYPMSDMPYFIPADTPVSHQISQIGINLPTYFDLQDNDIKRVCQALKKCLTAI